MADPKDPLAPMNANQELLDAPPEYTPLGASSSSGFAGPGPEAPPSEDTAHLFTRPPFAEDLFLSVDAERLHATTDVQWSVAHAGQVKSWDPKLKDPMALYEFIRYHAQIPPQIKLMCRGAHTETRHSTDTTTENGRTRSEHNTRQETVLDFDFSIDLTPLLQPPTVPSSAVDFFPIAPWAPTYRGSPHLSCAPLSRPTTASPSEGISRRETKLWKDWVAHRWDRGLPSWLRMPADYQASKQSVRRSRVALTEEGEGLLAPAATADVEGGRDRADIMQWCEAYCASGGKLKEFKVRKQVWGWDTKAVKTAVSSAILSTGYRSDQPVVVELVVTGDEIQVMPDFWLSRALHHRVIFFFSCFFLIYPVIWLWARWSRNDPTFDTVRVAYPLKAYVEATDKTPNQMTRMGPDGKRHSLVGTREGAWVREWEATIREAVFARRRGELTSRVDPVNNDAAFALDGYVREV